MTDAPDPSPVAPARVLSPKWLSVTALSISIIALLLTALPYIATIVVLALISRNPTWIRVNMPASLGKPFYPGS